MEDHVEQPQDRRRPQALGVRLLEHRRRRAVRVVEAADQVRVVPDGGPPALEAPDLRGQRVTLFLAQALRSPPTDRDRMEEGGTPGWADRLRPHITISTGRGRTHGSGRNCPATQNCPYHIAVHLPQTHTHTRARTRAIAKQCEHNTGAECHQLDRQTTQRGYVCPARQANVQSMRSGVARESGRGLSGDGDESSRLG